MIRLSINTIRETKNDPYVSTHSLLKNRTLRVSDFQKYRNRRRYRIVIISCKENMDLIRYKR